MENNYMSSRQVYERAILNQHLEDAIIEAIKVNPYKSFFERSFKGLIFTARKRGNIIVITYNDDNKEIKHTFTYE